MKQLLRILIFASLIFSEISVAQEKQLTVKDLYTDPGLSPYKYQEKNFRWTLEGNSITYFETIGEDMLALLRLYIESENVDTIFTSSDLVWINKEDTVQLNARRFEWSPEGDNLLLYGQNDFFLYKIKTGLIDRITYDEEVKRDVKFSPDSKWLSYVKNYDLWITDIKSRESIQLTIGGNENLLNGELDWVYPEELQIRTGYQWAPDSKKIAFLQMDESEVPKFPIPDLSKIHPEIYFEHYPKAGNPNPEVRIGVVDTKTKEITWIKPDSNEYIPRFDWLPNSSRLAVQTLNRSQNQHILYFVNPVAGQYKKIVEERDSCWLNISHLYYFFKDRDNFIWYSERDGYTHLYLYDYDGKMIKQLTKGKWCVTDLNSVDEENSVVYFTANKKSLIERHLYSVSLKSGKIKEIVKSRGVHSGNFSETNEYFLEYFTDSDTPTEIYLTSNRGKREKLLFKNEDFNKQKYEFGNTKFVEIPAKDGAILYGSLLFPADFDKDRKYPVLVYVYGGPHSQVVQNRFTRPWFHLLTQRGYIIFSVDNRGSYGRSYDWERKIYKNMGFYELQDQLEGVEYLKSLEYIDSTRIGIWGWSYGGYMVLNALTKASDVFKTGIAVAPVTNWKFYDSIYTERYMGLPEGNSVGYYKSSPLNFVENIKSNFLLVHGTGDDNVHFQNSTAFIDELIKYNKHFELMIYPGRKHGISDKEASIHLYEKMTEFTEKNL